MMVATDFSREDLRIVFTSYCPPDHGGAATVYGTTFPGRRSVLLKETAATPAAKLSLRVQRIKM
jgi:hypothetical protein